MPMLSQKSWPMTFTGKSGVFPDASGLPANTKSIQRPSARAPKTVEARAQLVPPPSIHSTRRGLAASFGRRRSHSKTRTTFLVPPSFLLSFQFFHFTFLFRSCFFFSLIVSCFTCETTKTQILAQNGLAKNGPSPLPQPIQAPTKKLANSVCQIFRFAKTFFGKFHHMRRPNQVWPNSGKMRLAALPPSLVWLDPPLLSSVPPCSPEPTKPQNQKTLKPCTLKPQNHKPQTLNPLHMAAQFLNGYSRLASLGFSGPPAVTMRVSLP